MRRGYIAAAIVVAVVAAWWFWRKRRGLSVLPGVGPRATSTFASRTYEAAGKGLPPRNLPRDVSTYDSVAVPLSPGARGSSIVSAGRSAVVDLETRGCERVGAAFQVPAGLSGGACGAQGAIAGKVYDAHVAVVKTAYSTVKKLNPFSW